MDQLTVDGLPLYCIIPALSPLMAPIVDVTEMINAGLAALSVFEEEKAVRFFDSAQNLWRETIDSSLEFHEDIWFDLARGDAHLTGHAEQAVACYTAAAELADLAEAACGDIVLVPYLRLAMVYSFFGKEEAAEEQYSRALVKAEAFDEDQPILWAVRHNAALGLADRFAAKVSVGESVAALLDLLGPTHPWCGTALRNRDIVDHNFVPGFIPELPPLPPKPVVKEKKGKKGKKGKGKKGKKGKKKKK